MFRWEQWDDKTEYLGHDFQPRSASSIEQFYEDDILTSSHSKVARKSADGQQKWKKVLFSSPPIKREEIPPDRMLASKRFQEERSVKGGVLRDVTKITECRSWISISRLVAAINSLRQKHRVAGSTK